MFFFNQTHCHLLPLIIFFSFWSIHITFATFDTAIDKEDLNSEDNEAVKEIEDDLKHLEMKIDSYMDKLAIEVEKIMNMQEKFEKRIDHLEKRLGQMNQTTEANVDEIEQLNNVVEDLTDTDIFDVHFNNAFRRSLRLTNDFPSNLKKRKTR